MILFLTSSPTGPLDGSRPVFGLDEMNGFVDNLKLFIKNGDRALIAAADPDDFGQNDGMCNFFYRAFKRSGIDLSTLDLMDRRYVFSADELQAYDLIILGGGHVLTQNKYFEDIGLREKLREYKGVLIGISAGSMNCASVVYNEPELPGEAVNPDFPRFIPGLGFTDKMIIPHYNQVKHILHDGMTFEEMNYPFSYGKSFLVLCDGSYLMSNNGEDIICGEAYRLEEGKMSQCCWEDERLITS